jgi:tRNA dimethylallyltransferase
MDIKSKIILISGPTASGKSNFAIKVAKKINGEIINADSMQVYKQLNILTARPKKKDQINIKHHLYGFQSVTKKFSTGAWLKLVKNRIKEIQKRNKIPILVGGTGLYFRSITEGLVKMPNVPLRFRNKVRLLQKRIGQKKFYQNLIKIDPLLKNQINPNDTQRTIRAFEIKKFTKKSITQWFKRTKILFDPTNFVKIYIDFPREELVNRIKKRVDQMFKEGAILEVKKFNRLKVKKDNSSKKVIGIEEINKLLNGELNLIEAKERIFIKTRQYAKRQTTWARGQMKSWQKINPNNLRLTLKKLK